MKLFSLFRKGPPEPKPPRIIEAVDDDFRLQVLERSHKQAVLVDFWAAWCGPCRQLSPILEKLALEPDSPFVLVKVNTEANSHSPARYRVRSIPAVKLFRNGHVAAEFNGVMPAERVRHFLRESLAKPAPAPKIQVSVDPDERLTQARRHLRRARGFPAFVLLSDFPSGVGAEEAARLLPLARFLVDMADGDAYTGHPELDEAHLAALVALEKGRPQAAAERLVEAWSLAGSATTASVMQALAAYLGDDHPMSEKLLATAGTEATR